MFCQSMRPESVAAIRRSLRAEVVTRASVSGRRAALTQRRGSVRACALSLPANASRWLYGASRSKQCFVPCCATEPLAAMSESWFAVTCSAALWARSGMCLVEKVVTVMLAATVKLERGLLGSPRSL